MSASARLEALRRVCGKCGHVHYATVCHICKTPVDPSVWTWSTGEATPARHLLRLVETSLAALGLAVAIGAGAAWWARDDLAAWYRTLPVVVAAKYCPEQTAGQ